MEDRTTKRKEELLGIVLWRREEPLTLDHCLLIKAGRYFGIAGRVLTTIQDEPTYIEYGVRWDPDESTSGLLIKLRQGLSKSEMRLERDRDGNWKRDGKEVEELRGIIEPDLEFTPSTNTLPIRRLNLEVGQTAEVDAAWVRFPDLSVQRLNQRYTRTSGREYRYESGGGDFVADIEVDDEGLVLRYGETWRRVGS